MVKDFVGVDKGMYIFYRFWRGVGCESSNVVGVCR